MTAVGTLFGAFFALCGIGIVAALFAADDRNPVVLGAIGALALAFAPPRFFRPRASFASSSRSSFGVREAT